MANAQIAMPTDYSADQQDIERRRKYAELLSQQSMQPLESNQMAGGWVVPVSPMQGFAKLAQSYMGAKGQKQATAEQKALSEKMHQQGAADVQSLVAALQGTPAQAPLTPNDDEGNPMPGVPAMPPDKSKALSIALSSNHPMVQAAGNTMLADMLKGGESAFAKIDPSKFTPESVKAFAATGSKDFSLLKPLKPLHFADTGSGIQAIDPITGQPVGTALAKDVSPDARYRQTTVSAGDQARLDQADRHWASLSPYQQKELEMQGKRLGLEGQRLRLAAADTFYNTGMAPIGGGGVPSAPGFVAPQPAPQQPQGTPPGATPGYTPGYTPPIIPQQPATVPRGTMPQAPTQPPVMPQGALPPKVQNQIAAASATQRAEMQNKRDFNMQGLNSAIDEAEAILSGKDGPKPTQSMIGAGVDWLGQAVGMAPAGAAQADKLKAIGGILTSKVPRMEGPQSDKDVQLYREMAGQVGDNTLPVSRRLAALQTVRQLMGKYERQNMTGNAPAGNVRTVDW